MASISVVPGIPVSLVFPNYTITYSFNDAPAEMPWVSADGTEAGIAPFIRMPGAAIWSGGPQTLFYYIESLCDPLVDLGRNRPPWKFVIAIRGMISVNTIDYPVYATEAKDEIIVRFTCGVLGTFDITCGRTRIRDNIASYEFNSSKTLGWNVGDNGLSNPGWYAYLFDANSDPGAGFKHRGLFVFTIGGGIGSAWASAI